MVTGVAELPKTELDAGLLPNSDGVCALPIAVELPKVGAGLAVAAAPNVTPLLLLLPVD